MRIRVSRPSTPLNPDPRLARVAGALLSAGLGACTGAPSPQAYRDALSSGACDTLTDPSLRDDCWLAHLDPTAPEPCVRLTTQKLVDECHFEVAERTGDLSYCREAGAFADDCGIHLLAASFPKWVPADALPGAYETVVEGHARAAGFADTDPRPWTAYYRWLLGNQHPMDRATCDVLPDPNRRDLCRQAGIALYHDLLNVARDRGVYPCDEAPLPDFLQYAPDPALDMARRRRRPELCRVAAASSPSP